MKIVSKSVDFHRAEVVGGDFETRQRIAHALARVSSKDCTVFLINAQAGLFVTTRYDDGNCAIAECGVEMADLVLRKIMKAKETLFIEEYSLPVFDTILLVNASKNAEGYAKLQELVQDWSDKCEVLCSYIVLFSETSTGFAAEVKMDIEQFKNNITISQI